MLQKHQSIYIQPKIQSKIWQTPVLTYSVWPFPFPCFLIFSHRSLLQFFIGMLSLRRRMFVLQILLIPHHEINRIKNFILTWQFLNSLKVENLFPMLNKLSASAAMLQMTVCRTFFMHLVLEIWRLSVAVECHRITWCYTWSNSDMYSVFDLESELGHQVFSIGSPNSDI